MGFLIFGCALPAAASSSSRRLPHTQLVHTQLAHTQLAHTQLVHTQLLTHNLALGDAVAVCVAGVALGDIDVHSAWQAWHLQHWAGSGGALGPCLAPLSPRLFVWQVWHLATSTCILRGRRGTHSSFTQPVLHHLLSFLPFPSHFHICLVIIGRN